MKKSLITPVAAAASLALLAGCTGGDDGSSSSEGGGGDATTISYGLWDSNQLPAYQQCAADFSAANPQYTVDIEQIGWDDYWSKITTGFVSGENYDVFTSHVAYYPEFQKNNQVLPLDEYIAADGVDLSVYQDGLVDLWQSPDGVQYGLPKDFDTIALFYNEQMAEAAGLSAEDMAGLTWNPDDGGTYEQAIAHLTIDANGVRGDEPGFDKDNVDTYGLWMEGAGGADGQTQWSFLTASLGWTQTDGAWAEEYHFDDPRFAETIDWWYSLVEKGYMPSYAAQEGISWADQLIAGKAAIVPNGSWMTGYVFGSASDTFTPAVAETPVGPDGSSWSMLNGLADNISATTDNPDAAWAWVKYLGSADCQDVVADAAVVFPAIKTSTDKAVAAFEANGVGVSAFTDHVDAGTTVLFPITDFKSDVNAIMAPAMEAIMSGSTGTDSLVAANESVNALFN
ncbi:ABC transporter substrate-binding protein [Demequina zhanjiangensis]|uniref:Sugar ABC transporter substrate-binding protein n=1 Tax=Demequina zhanjiangensis TaxID=3051659 RepID=A0ABT8FZV5_9MICO|nr:sugar ABC transporter substrate-binding protein [Demequina sp. SYSU T00b26]MDN4472426.1 sugar ABC transporter substrate-binding protein [Demequina sp. SYSU T00b26]